VGIGFGNEGFGYATYLTNRNFILNCADRLEEKRLWVRFITAIVALVLSPLGWLVSVRIGLRKKGFGYNTAITRTRQFNLCADRLKEKSLWVLWGDRGFD